MERRKQLETEIKLQVRTTLGDEFEVLTVNFSRGGSLNCIRSCGSEVCLVPSFRGRKTGNSGYICISLAQALNTARSALTAAPMTPTSSLVGMTSKRLPCSGLILTISWTKRSSKPMSMNLALGPVM
jgi:hypothetical protein